MIVTKQEKMEHYLVFPMHDPTGMIIPHLERITPVLKEVFSGAVISVTPGEQVRLLADTFYRPVTVAADTPVGEHFRALYTYAAETCPPAVVLHLCFADRLAFQMESGFRQDFFASMRRLQRDSLPLIFQRSTAAWATHPGNYREIEAAVGMAGRWVFGRQVDFAWCHLAVEAETLRKILPAVHRPDMSMVAEIAVQLIKEIQTEDVDWLAWEDPFILGREADELFREREASLEETRKRLAYALPMMEVIKKRSSLMRRIELWEEAPGFDPALGQEAPGLNLFLLDDGQPHGLVVVFPGGGYNHLAAHEREPIAEWLNAAGFSACVLNYRVAPYRHPAPLQDAARAVRTVRAHAAEWGVRPDKIGVLGFSAGGHLAATLATQFDAGDPAATDPVERVSSRPDAAVLCYAVVTFTRSFSHAGSGQSLVGENPAPGLRESLSAENRVTPNTPPCFLWHTADDEKVPVQNCLVFADALHNKDVPFELHVFPHGRHGLGLANDDPTVGQWKALCANWLKGLGF